MKTLKNPPPELSLAIRRRESELYREHQFKIYRDTDLLFSWFLVAQWVACIFCALYISPKAWSGTSNTVHIHVWSAIFLGGLIFLFPAFLAFTRAGRTETRYVIAIGQMLGSALLIDLTGGRIETHFHVFGSLAILAFYRDWKVLVPATVVVALDHWIRGVYWPQSVYGILVPEPWRWLEHTGWVVFEDIFLIISCIRSQKEMKEVASSKAQYEHSHQIVEAKVVERTIELRKSEERFRQSEKMAAVGQLAGGIAHDLNNGLTPVMGYLDFLLNETRQNAAAHELLSEAKKSAVRCAEVVEKLLSFSRPSEKKKMRIQVEKMLEEYKTMLRTVLPATIELSIHSFQDAGMIYGNENEIMTVLVNLAINSRDAMAGKSGKFCVEAKKIPLDTKILKPGFNPGNYAVFSVSDNGKGISPQNLPKIFEPFFSTKSKSEGTGLGLSMVFNIIRDHGGWVDVSSVEGQGTTFQIYLPSALKDGSQEPAPPPEQNLALARRNETILFVDDEESLRNLGSVFLTQAGYRPVLACDGEEAVRLYRTRRDEIDAIILDMTMPHVPGRETIRRLLEINPSAKIIASSGYTSEGNEKDILLDGGGAFLRKPYTLAVMAELLREVLNAEVKSHIVRKGGSHGKENPGSG